MKTHWIIKTPIGDETIQCDNMGITNDGSLLAFESQMPGEPPVPVMGWSPGNWNKFSRSTLRGVN